MLLKVIFTALLGVSSLAAAEELPKDLKWETNENPTPIASPEAKAGGTFRIPMSTYPLTFRTVGPDSNTVLYTYLLDNQWSMTTIHPNTREIIPLLATHWAFGKDGKTMYYKIDPKARWSDGKPVTAEDFAFTVEFMRSKNIMAPWYNNFYTQEIDAVIVFDPQTVAVRLTRAKPDLHLWADVAPTPKHFYQGAVAKDFVQKYNWAIVPNTGPYAIDPKDIKRGKSVAFVRKRDWWANDRPYFKNRYNVERVLFKVVREQTVMWEQFRKRELDAFALNDPIYWHEKSNIDIFKNGYAHKLWFYNDAPQSCFGIWLNTRYAFFKDPQVRRAVSHAMNFDKVIATVQRGETERMQTCTDGYGDYSNPKVRALAFDLAKTGDLLDKAGFTTRDKDGYRVNKDGQRLEFDVLYAYDAHTPQLVVLAEEAKKAGVRMNLQLKDWSAMLKQMNDYKHQANFSGFGGRDVGIPEYWGQFHGSNANKPDTNNISGIDDLELNKLIEQFDAGTKKEERVALAQKIDEKISELAVFIPATKTPYFRVGYWRWWRQPKVPATKLSSSAFDVFSADRGGLFWLDEGLKKETEAAMKSGKPFEAVTIKDESFRKASGKKDVKG